MAGIYTANVQEPTVSPIQPYERRIVVLRPWDPRVVEVAARVTAIVQSRRPDLHIEHIGSTAVPGLPGKGIVDLGTEADPAEIPAITQAMHELGFGPQPGPDPWPPSRPMHVGSVVDGGVEYRIHFHVHPRGAGDLAKDLRFRDALEVDSEIRVISAHRAPDLLARFIASAEGRGISVFIAIAGLAAHLPGVVASQTILPVIGVPMAGGVSDGLDALLAIVQMPKGVPVATVGVGNGENAALLAAAILAVGDPRLRSPLTARRGSPAAALAAGPPDRRP